MVDRYGLMGPRIKTKDNFKPIESCELEKIRSMLRFYDFHTMNSISGYDAVVRYKCPNPSRFGDVVIGNCSLETYEKLETVIMSFFIKGVQLLSEQICYIIKYDKSWVVDKRLCVSLATLLSNKQITDAYSGICVEKESKVIELFAKSCFRYNSFVQFAFPETQLIITPTDHLDIFFSSPAKQELRELLTKTISSDERKLLDIKTAPTY